MASGGYGTSLASNSYLFLWMMHRLEHSDDELLMILSGAAGTGKTSVLKIIEKLFEHLYGPKSFQRSAPTNTAARLLCGDTSHALYKLPLQSLHGRRGRLTSKALQHLRRRWRQAKGHVVDDMSMLTPQCNYQIDMRSRSAKQEYHSRYGKLATSISGDFLQLPPVR